jgi:LmbE family N-acetylglucosaminyl deacetylase
MTTPVPGPDEPGIEAVKRTVAELGTIASIWAHPDDETYLAGGIMAAAVANGQRVTCVCATAGEHGTSDPQSWPPARLARVRRWEAAAAMAVLGVTDHRWLGHPDGCLADLDPAQPVAQLAGILAEVQPDTILTFGPDGGTFHPDHQTVSAWVGCAWRQAGRPGRILHSTVTDEHLRIWGDRYEQWGVFMTDRRPVGVRAGKLVLHARLAGAALDQKVTALCAMHTQTASAIALLGEEDFRASNAEESFIDARRGHMG